MKALSTIKRLKRIQVKLILDNASSKKIKLSLKIYVEIEKFGLILEIHTQSKY